MSQGDVNDLSQPNPDRSRPRYRPLTVSTRPPLERPTDWPAPVDNDPGLFNPPNPASWGTYPKIEPAQRAYQNSYNSFYSNSYYNDEQLYAYGRLHHRRSEPGSNSRNTGYVYKIPQPQNYNDPRAVAAWRVRRKLRFFRHLKIYLIINVIMWLVALPGVLLFHGHFWPIYMSLFWGLGLFFEYRRTFFTQADHRRHRMIEDEMRRIKY